MTRLPPRTLTVRVDYREKLRYRIRFPTNVRWWFNGASCLVAVKVAIAQLDTGDYAVYDRKERCVACIEKKGSMSELRTNLLTADHRRLVAEWRRLQLIPYRGVLLTFPWRDFFHATMYVPEPVRILDRLQRDCARFGLDLLICPPGKDNRGVGTFLCHWFLARLQQHQETIDQKWHGGNHGKTRSP